MSRVILCVTEKNSVAAEVSRILSNSNYTKRFLMEQFNEYSFMHPEYEGGAKQQYIVLHAQGHMLELQPAPGYEWGKCPHNELFTCDLQFKEPNAFKRGVLQPHAATMDVLLLMLDADREGENIGYDIIDMFCSILPAGVWLDIRPSMLPKIRTPSKCILQHLLTSDNTPVDHAIKRIIKVKRARFIGLTYEDLTAAIYNAGSLDMNVVDAVDVRQFTDLRLGYAITRLQTEKLRSAFVDYRTGAFKAKKPISFGPCQVPTLGLVHSNDLYSLQSHQKGSFSLKLICDPRSIEETDGLFKGLFTAFNSRKSRVSQSVLESEQITFIPVDKTSFRSYLGCLPVVKLVFDALRTHKNTVEVSQVYETSYTIYRPYPITTLDMQRALSKHFSSKTVMQIAETLYTRGLISYPRTETKSYPSSYTLEYFKRIVTKLTKISPEYVKNCAHCVEHAKILISEEFGNPYIPQLPKSNSASTDNAHLPIHPLSYPKNPLSEREGIVYLYIVRSFLASIYPDAQGSRNLIEIEPNGCKFRATINIIKFDGFKRVLRASNRKNKNQIGNSTILSSSDVSQITTGSKLLVLKAPFTQTFGSQDLNVLNPTDADEEGLVVASTLWTANTTNNCSLISLDDSNDSGEVVSFHEPEPDHFSAQNTYKVNMDLTPLPMKESSLLLEMDRHGIGTDATMAEHIELITNREYINSRKQIEPLGAELLHFYKQSPMGVQALSCSYRSMLEHGMCLISDGKLDCKTVYDDCISWGKSLYHSIDKMQIIKTNGYGSYNIPSTASSAPLSRVNVSIKLKTSPDMTRGKSPFMRIKGRITCCDEPCSKIRNCGSCHICGRTFQIPRVDGVIIVLTQACPQCSLSLVSITLRDARIPQTCLRCNSMS